VTEKGYPEFVRSAQPLLNKHPRLHLLCVGHRLKSERPALVWNPEAALVAGGIPAERFTVLDNRDDMPELYAVMDLHVLPSYREGFPYVLMEGAASGLPQIATDIRGCRQTVADGETGFLVPVGDSEMLSAYMDRLLSGENVRARISQAARAKAEREFDQREVFRRVAECYERMLKEKGLG